jgi:hypothetical protein
MKFHCKNESTFVQLDEYNAQYNTDNDLLGYDTM